MRAPGLPVQFWHLPASEQKGGTRFLCRTLTERERAQIFTMCAGDDQGNVTITHEGLMFALDRGLLGWENYTTENGEPVEFMPHNVLQIPAAEQIALANTVINNSSLSDEEKKKLSIALR